MNKKSDIIKVAIVVILLSSVQMMVCSYLHDDATVREQLKSTPLLEHYLNDVRLGGWSSRLAIDLIRRLLLLTDFGFVLWKILTVLLNLLTVYVLVNTFGHVYRNTDWIIVVAIVFMYPFYHQSSAGWLSTSVTYWWSACCCIISACICYKICNNKNVKIGGVIGGILATLYGADNELGCAFLFVTLSSIVIMSIITKRINVYAIILEIIIVVRMCVHIIWQSQGRRAVNESIYWFQDFTMRGTLEKIQAGFSSACILIFKNQPFPLFVLCLVLFILIWKKYNDIFYRAVSSFPLFLVSVEGVFRNQINSITFNEFDKIDSSYIGNYGMVTNNNYYQLQNYFIIALWIIAIVCVLISLICLLEKNSVYLICMLGGGFGAKLVMGFSPTISASSDRTGIYLLWAIMVVDIILMYILNKRETKFNNCVIGAACIISGITFLNSVLCGLNAYYV